MIGQEKIKHLLRNKVPNSIILVGNQGSGKTTLANYLSAELNYEFVVIEELSVPQMKKLTEDSLYSAFGRIYCIENVEAMSHLAQNVLLKTLEDVNDKIIFVLCVNDKSKLLPTIVSRCVVLSFDTYTQQELQLYSDTRASSIDTKYCSTPGDILYKKYLIDTGIYEELIKLAMLVANKITSATVGNVFKIINRLETIGADKAMALWLLNVLVSEFKDNYEMNKKCLEYKYHIMNNNTDWKRTLQQLFVLLNGMEN